MSADLSRQRFNPLKNLSGVLQQQGRVQLDADWNEFVEILDRRFRAETTDIIGRCVVPRETPDGFKITVSGSDLNIGPGRIYVDGLLAENHGDAPARFDAVLGELCGSNPVLYSKQPYLPSAKIADLTQPAPLLVYIDVWEREVTYIEDPDLVEKAVGVDTTARLQTVWQVKVLPNVGNNATCSSDIQAWNDLIAPSAGRLTTAAHGAPSITDPCLIPPTGGYLGLENRTYRVEIHDVDATGKATFKWSGDNASVATNITAVDGTGTILTVDSVGRDSVLCFKAGQWVEITDDVREFDQEPGIMRKVLSVLDKTITLGTALTGADLPNLAQHARIKRWDQSGKVVDSNNQPVYDLDAPPAGAIPGVIPVLLGGTSLLLENGVQVTFSLDPAGGKFHSGDYWVFAARTADASVEVLTNAAPRIHHHLGRLAIVKFPGPASDCRILWPPEECCDCSVCVSADSHNNGTFTIQQAIDKIKDVGGTICLGPGLYLITSANPVRIDGARSIRLKGQSWATILFSMEGPGVVISNSLRVTVEDLSVAAVGRSDFAGLAVSIVNSTAVTLQRCAIVQWGFELDNAGGTSGGAAVGLSGFVMETRICDNVMYGADGIAGVGQRFEPGFLVDFRFNLTALLRIDDNCIFASGTGVNFDGSFIHLAETRIAGNFIAGCKSAGTAMRGVVYPGGLLGSRLDIHGNVVTTAGHGIVISTSQTRITNNDVGASTTLSPDETRDMSLNAGILLEGREGNRIDQCQILENRINRMGGVGIRLAAQIGSAMIKQNIIDSAGLGGIVMDFADQASAEVLTIENNQISNVAAGFNGGGALMLLGIGVRNTRQATIAGNTIIGVGLTANPPVIGGIGVIDSISARIVGNIVYDIAPASKAVEGFFLRLGIFVTGAIGRLDVLDNDVNRNRDFASQGANDGTIWFSLIIQESITNMSTGPSQTVANSDTQFRVIDGMILPVPRGPETIGVRGNLLDGYGVGTPIFVQSKGACLFGDNRCNFVPMTDFRPPIADITCEAIIANANFFQTSRNEKTVLLNPGNGPITVLGNISSGPILINNATMHGTPWATLNIPTS
jgi:hypothetical protein